MNKKYERPYTEHRYIIIEKKDMYGKKQTLRLNLDKIYDNGYESYTDFLREQGFTSKNGWKFIKIVPIKRYPRLKREK